MGITVRIKGVLRTTQRIVRINPGLRRGDIVYTEPETVAPLAYFNEDNGAEYLFEHRVDIYHEATDFTRANNYYSYTWWAIDPRLRDAPESLVFGNMEDLEQSDPAERVERGA